MFLKSTIALFITVLFLTDGNAQKYGRVKGSGNVIDKTRTVNSFEKIAVSGSFDVLLVKGKSEKLDIKIEDNLLEYLITEVKDGQLKIKWKKGANISTRKGVEITVYFNSLNAINLSGSGEIESEEVIKANSFEMAVSGSGDIDISIESDVVIASVSGSGDLDLEGKVNSFEAKVSGSGDISAYGLISENANLKVSGSGGITITVNKVLKAVVVGSGDIEYKGNPEKEDIKVSGSGNVSLH